MDAESIRSNNENSWAWLVRSSSKNPEWSSAKLRSFLPTMDSDCSYEPSNPEVIHRQLNRSFAQGMATWKSFINDSCFELDVPFDMEIPLVSIWGPRDEFSKQLGAGEESCPGPQSYHGAKRPFQSYGSSPRRKNSKKQQLELAKKYSKLSKTSAQQWHGGVCPGAWLTPHSPQTYIPPVLQWSRATAPLDAQEGATLGDPEAADNIDVSIQDLFSFKAHKGPRVTVLSGKAGMGKTTSAYRLRWRWAQGQSDRFQASFSFEFRQLNMITQLPTSPQLLFDSYLMPESEPDAVFQYLKENAQEVLSIFDGLDEALHADSVGTDNAGSALTLFSELCHGNLSPGCWVMTTSRPGKSPSCVPTEAATVHMWGFDGLRVEKYVTCFFSDLSSQELALKEMRTNARLRGMCAIPALCTVTCFCLRRSLPGSSPGQSAALSPTITQLYSQMVETFSPSETSLDTSILGFGKVALRGSDTGKVVFSVEDISPQSMASGAVHSLSTSFCIHTRPGHEEIGYAFVHLSSQEFFAASYSMASHTVDKDTLVEYVTLNSHWVSRTKGRSGLSDHLPAFSAGLASHTCHTFLCQSAQQDRAWVGSRQAAVIQVLRKLASRKLTGPKMIELYHCVAETQDSESARFTAQSLPSCLSFHKFPSTHADSAASANILEHRDDPIHSDFDGCPSEPHCPEASVGCGQVENLSFKSRKCGDAFAEALCRSLPTMGSSKTSGLTGSRITAQGISHSIQTLPLCSQSEEVSLHDNQLKDPEVSSLVESLPSSPKLQKLDSSRNSFSRSILSSLVKVAITCPTVRKSQVRELDLIFYSSPVTETATQQSGASDIQGKDSSKEGQSRSSQLRLQKCQLRIRDAEALVELFQKSPQSEEVNLSGNHLEDDGCRLVAEATSQLHIAQKSDLSDNGLSQTGVTYVLKAMSTCGTSEDSHISSLSNTVVLTFAQEPREQEGSCKGRAPLISFVSPVTSELSQRSRRIRSTHCGFSAKHTETLCEASRASCQTHNSDHLDLSDNSLGGKGVISLTESLPGSGPSKSLNLSRNGLSMDAVFSLVQCSSSLQWVFHLDVSLESDCIFLRGAGTSRDALEPKFQTGVQVSESSQQYTSRSFCLQECQLEPTSLTFLCATSEKSPGPSEVQLSCKSSSDDSSKISSQCSPQSPQLSSSQSRHTVLSSRSPFSSADIFNSCPRVRKVTLRSLCHAVSHFDSNEEQEGVCCGFPGCSLSQEHMETSCCASSKCNALSQLDLTDNSSGDIGLRCLSECSPQSPISGWLDLSHNNISQEGISYSSETSPSYPNIQEVSVSSSSEQIFRMCFSKKEGAGTSSRLCECSFSPEQVSKLASSSSQAQQLTELWSTKCHLDSPQSTMLSNSVNRPTGLSGLRLEEPWVDSVSLPALMEVCAQASGCLTELSISEIQRKLWLQSEFPHQEGNSDSMALRLAHCDSETEHSHLMIQLVETYARSQQSSLSQVSFNDNDGTSSKSSQNISLSSCESKSFRSTFSQVSTKSLTHSAFGSGHCHHSEESDFSNNSLREEDTELSMGALQGTCRSKKSHLSFLPLGASSSALLIQGLSRMTLLQDLCLSHNQIGDVGTQCLAAILPKSPELRKFDLSHNQIGDVGTQCLAAILPKLPELRKFNLSHNQIGHVGTQCLAAILPKLPELRKFDLSRNQIGDVGTQCLAAILPKLPELRKFDLSGNRIGPAGGVQSVKSLTHFEHLEEIKSGNNASGEPTASESAQRLPPQLRVSCSPSSHSGPEGASGSAQASEQCPHIEEVSLAENNSAGGVPRFSKRLPSLRQIDSEFCKIEDQAARHLAANLTLFPASEKLLSSGNLLGDEVAAELAQVSPQMGQSKKVNLEWNRITARGAQLSAQGSVQGSCVPVIRLWNNPILNDVAQSSQSQEPRSDFSITDQQTL